MPLYPFKNPKTGEVKDAFFEMSDPNLPGIGQEGPQDLVGWIRLPCLTHALARRTLHFESHQLPRFYKPHIDAGGACDPRTGKPRFESWRQMRESEAAAAWAGDHMEYDAAP